MVTTYFQILKNEVFVKHFYLIDPSCIERISYDFHRLQDSSIYYFIHYEQLNRQAAREKCVQLGGDLVSILTQTENDFLYG